MTMARPLLQARHRMTTSALPFGETPVARDSRAVSILAKSIYRDLRSSGFEARDVVALASELLAHVTSEVSSLHAAVGPRR